MIKMFVFDMAGTVIDENNIVYKTLQKAINNEGFAFTLESVLQEGAGKEKLQAIKDILQNQGSVSDMNLAKKIYSNFISYLEYAYDIALIKSQPGAIDLFNELKSREVLVALNTGYDAKTAQALLHKVGWKIGKEIDAMVTASDVECSRPHPDMIHLLKKKFGLTNSNQIVKVGDSRIDIEEGKNAGCLLSIGITTGAQPRAQLALAKPDMIIDSLAEIIPALYLQHGL